MKIISQFSDYYDIGLAYGIDEKLRFERDKICKNLSKNAGSCFYQLYKTISKIQNNALF